MKTKEIKEIVEKRLIQLESDYKVYKIKKKLSRDKEYYRIKIFLKNEKNYRFHSTEAPDPWQLETYIEQDLNPTTNWRIIIGK